MANQTCEADKNTLSSSRLGTKAPNPNYGCPSYHKTGESYYNLHQLGITNCVDRQLLKNAVILITKCILRFYYEMLLQPLLQNE